MTTHSPQSSGGSIYFPCSPDQFAVFKRGDKVVRTAPSIPLSFEWVLSGEPPQHGKVYIVRDYHWGNSVSPDSKVVYGQIINTVECVCALVPQAGNVEYGWHWGGFRKVTEEEIAAAARQTQEAGL